MRFASLVPQPLVACILTVLAVAAAWADGVTEFRDAAELTVKETDRVATTAAALTSLGIAAEGRPDGLVVRGGGRLRGAEVDSGGDHRIAMAFAVAALRAQGESMIHGAESAKISCPEFFTMLESVTER